MCYTSICSVMVSIYIIIIYISTRLNDLEDVYMWNEASSLLDLAPSRRAPGGHHAAAPIARVEAQEHRDDHAHAVAHVVHAPQDGSIDAQLNAYRL